MKKTLTLLILMFIPLCGYSQTTTYKVVDKYDQIGAANNVIVLQTSDNTPLLESTIIEEARKYLGRLNLTVVFYWPSAVSLPFQKLNTCAGYSNAHEMAQTGFYYAVYTRDAQGNEKITYNPRYR